MIMWEPTVEEAEGSVTPSAAAALHGLLDGPGPPPTDGEPLPLLWHWLAFLPSAAQRDLGPDGHPRPGSFLPPVELARRMYAGGRVDAHGRVRVGDRLRRQSRVTDVVTKDGRSGPLAFVEVTHEITTDDGDGLVEVQDLVYRGPSRTPEADDAASGRPDEAVGSAWCQRLRPDPTMLFRFSALTYNAHRIHYDRPYAEQVEGYPGLVVHGPLQAIALAELCRRNRPEAPLRSFWFRSERPAFEGSALDLVGRPAANGRIDLTAMDPARGPTMTAGAELVTR